MTTDLARLNNRIMQENWRQEWSKQRDEERHARINKALYESSESSDSDEDPELQSPLYNKLLLSPTNEDMLRILEEFKKANQAAKNCKLGNEPPSSSPKKVNNQSSIMINVLKLFTACFGK